MEISLKKLIEKDIKELANANATPMAADAKNMRQKRPIPWNTSWPVVMLVNLGEPISSMVVVNTMATASFRMLSPNTSMFRTGSTSSAWNMASVATGSTALTNDPKAKLSMMLSL